MLALNTPEMLLRLPYKKGAGGRVNFVHIGAREQGGLGAIVDTLQEIFNGGVLSARKGDFRSRSRNQGRISGVGVFK